MTPIGPRLSFLLVAVPMPTCPSSPRQRPQDLFGSCRRSGPFPAVRDLPISTYPGADWNPLPCSGSMVPSPIRRRSELVSQFQILKDLADIGHQGGRGRSLCGHVETDAYLQPLPSAEHWKQCSSDAVPDLRGYSPWIRTDLVPAVSSASAALRSMKAGGSLDSVSSAAFSLVSVPASPGVAVSASGSRVSCSAASHLSRYTSGSNITSAGSMASPKATRSNLPSGRLPDPSPKSPLSTNSTIFRFNTSSASTSRSGNRRGSSGAGCSAARRRSP